MTLSPPLRYRIDRAALQGNWRWLEKASGRAACGAAIKADGYGLGAREVVRALADVGCRDFFVATWAEAVVLGDADVSLAVLHGVREADMPAARAGLARPVLSTREQVQRWRAAGGGVCDVMVDTGMNRLGVSPDDVASGLLDGLAIETLMSHLACADGDHPLNARQRDAFAQFAGRTGAARMSLANSAGIALGEDYHFDLTRPGLALYGGVPRPEMATDLLQVVTPEAEVLQRRRVVAGQTVGYDATWTALADTEVAILNIGYADGYWLGFSSIGTAAARTLPVIGRVSMDLIAIDVSTRPDIAEGDWLALDFALPEAAARSGMSQYELLTGLGKRGQRLWE